MTNARYDCNGRTPTFYQLFIGGDRLLEDIIVTNGTARKPKNLLLF